MRSPFGAIISGIVSFAFIGTSVRFVIEAQYVPVLLIGSLLFVFLTWVSSRPVPVNKGETLFTIDAVVTGIDPLGVYLSWPKARPLWPLSWPAWLRNHCLTLPLRNLGFKKGDKVKLTIRKVSESVASSMHQPLE